METLRTSLRFVFKRVNYETYTSIIYKTLELSLMVLSLMMIMSTMSLKKKTTMV